MLSPSTTFKCLVIVCATFDLFNRVDSALLRGSSHENYNATNTTGIENESMESAGETSAIELSLKMGVLAFVFSASCAAAVTRCCINSYSEGNQYLLNDQYNQNSYGSVNIYDSLGLVRR